MGFTDMLYAFINIKGFTNNISIYKPGKQVYTCSQTGCLTVCPSLAVSEHVTVYYKYN